MSELPEVIDIRKVVAEKPSLYEEHFRQLSRQAAINMVTAYIPDSVGMDKNIVLSWLYGREGLDDYIAGDTPQALSRISSALWDHDEMKYRDDEGNKLLQEHDTA